MTVAKGEPIYAFPAPLADETGRSWRAEVFGNPAGNVWFGWIVFTDEAAGNSLWTGVETSQPDRDALRYWATGLEPVYLQGALARARGVAV